MRASKKRRNNELAEAKADRRASEQNKIVTIEHAWQGPLPSPDVLQRFDEIVEHGAERIFREWEMEAEHRRNYEMKALKASMWLDGLGRVTAFVFSMSALGVAAWAAAVGQTWVATLLGGGTIAAVATALIYKERAQHRSE